MPGHGGPHGGGPHGGGPHGGGFGGPHGGHGHMPPPPHRGYGMGRRPYRGGCLPGCLMPILVVVGIVVLTLSMIF